MTDVTTGDAVFVRVDDRTPLNENAKKGDFRSTPPNAAQSFRLRAVIELLVGERERLIRWPAVHLEVQDHGVNNGEGESWLETVLAC